MHPNCFVWYCKRPVTVPCNCFNSDCNIINLNFIRIFRVIQKKPSVNRIRAGKHIDKRQTNQFHKNAWTLLSKISLHYAAVHFCKLKFELDYYLWKFNILSNFPHLHIVCLMCYGKMYQRLEQMVLLGIFSVKTALASCVCLISWYAYPLNSAFILNARFKIRFIIIYFPNVLGIVFDTIYHTLFSDNWINKNDIKKALKIFSCFLALKNVCKKCDSKRKN